MRRLIVISFVFIAVLGFMLFSLAQGENDKAIRTSHLRLTQIAGKVLYDLKNCAECHTLGAKAEGKLTPVTNKRTDEWFKEHVVEESKIVLREAKSKKKQRRVVKKEVAAMDDFLYQSKAAVRTQIVALPEEIQQGAYLAYQNNCIGCHAIAGAGKEIGPDLTYVADKRNKEWLIANLKDPQQFSPQSPMPKFDKLPEEDLSKISDYLGTLFEQK